MVLPCFLSIDIGTASLRTSLVSETGHIIGTEKTPIDCRMSSLRMEQSVDNVWQTLVLCTRQLLQASQVTAKQIVGIGVDTTASFVLLDKALKPLSLPSPLSAHCNIFGWLDRRAESQAQEIKHKLASQLKEDCRLSAENHLSRLLWLKQNEPDLWQKCYVVIDLFDYITFRLTDQLTSSFLSLAKRFPQSYLDISGVGNSKLHPDIQEAISTVGQGLSKGAAKALDLPVGLPVATGIIDAYGGSLAVLLARKQSEKHCTLDKLTPTTQYGSWHIRYLYG